MIDWIKIEDEVPEKGRRLLYFFEGTGAWLGFYYGLDEEYCSKTGHVFGSQHGFLTGDVTHWCYIPAYPEGEEGRDEADREFAKEMEEEINSFKEPIG